LIKLKTSGSGNTKFSEIINAYGGGIMDFSNTSITVEITGSSERIDSFISQVKNESIMELCRSGAISMGLGAKNALDIKNLK
jgi:acetolactate synthase-1/3 small subunit